MSQTDGWTHGRKDRQRENSIHPCKLCLRGYNKMACVPSEDSDQPGHPPSLIRVFAVRMKKAWVLSYPLSAQRRL